MNMICPGYKLSDKCYKCPHSEPHKLLDNCTLDYLYCEKCTPIGDKEKNEFKLFQEER